MKKLLTLALMFSLLVLFVSCDKTDVTTTSTTVPTTSYRTFDFQYTQEFPSYFDRTMITYTNDEVNTFSECKQMIESITDKLSLASEANFESYGYEESIRLLMVEGKISSDDFYSQNQLEKYMGIYFWNIYMEISSFNQLLNEDYYGVYPEGVIFDDQESKYLYYFVNDDSFYFYEVKTSSSDETVNMYRFEFLEDGSIIFERYQQTEDSIAYINYSSKYGFTSFNARELKSCLSFSYTIFDYNTKTFDRLTVDNSILSQIITREYISYDDGIKMSRSKNLNGVYDTVAFYDTNYNFIFSSKVTTLNNEDPNTNNSFSLLYLNDWDYFTSEAVYINDAFISEIKSSTDGYVVEVPGNLTESLLSNPVGTLLFGSITLSQVVSLQNESADLIDGFTLENHVITVNGVSYSNDLNGVIQALDYYLNRLT